MNIIARTVIIVYFVSILKRQKSKEKKCPKGAKRTVFDKLKENVEEKLFWLEDCLNLDENQKYNITNDCLYEHSMFELIHQLKTIDFKKYDIIECGW